MKQKYDLSNLHGLGIQRVRDTADGADACKEMRMFPADIIITDLMMEPIDGIEFVRLTRTASDSPNRDVPIIMPTGHAEMLRVLEAKTAGASSRPT